MKYLSLFALLIMSMLFYQCEETLTGNSKITYEVAAVSFTDAVDQNNNGYASQIKFSFDINVSEGSADVYVVIGQRIHSAENNSYTVYFISKSFTITGDAKDNTYITIGDLELGELSHNSYDFLIQVYKADDNTKVVAQADFSKFSAMGDVLMETSGEDSPVSVQFNNPLYTDITVTINDTDTKVISPGDSVLFSFTNGNPGNIKIYAETWGKTSEGYQLGEKVIWNVTYDMSGKDFMKFTLNLSETMFFMFMKNTGTAQAVNWNPIYVNYGSDVEKEENIVIPNDGVLYRVGYYSYLSGSSLVAAQYAGSDGLYQWTVTSSNQVNQGWILSDESGKKPAVSIENIDPGELIYPVGGNLPVDRFVKAKFSKEAVNMDSNVK